MTAADESPYKLGAQFQAKFDGNCKGCDSAIYEGDLMGWVDDVAVCDDCYQAGALANRVALRDYLVAQRDAQREIDMARDPEGTLRREAAVKKWVDSVKAKAAQEPGKEWVTSPGATPGWVRNPDYEPPNEQEAPVAETVEAPQEVEPGIAALMAAGLLQGQEPGGSGVCNATIESAAGIVEVAIPVPVDPPVKARAPRKSRAKVKPEAPSADTAGGPGQAKEMVPAVDTAHATTPVTPEETAAHTAAVHADAARFAQLAENAKDWDPGQIEADVLAARGIDVNGPAKPAVDPLPVIDYAAAQAILAAKQAAPVMNTNEVAVRRDPEAPFLRPVTGFVEAAQVDALQVGLSAAVASGAMTPEQATALGWTSGYATMTEPAPADPWVDPPALTGPPPAASPRTVEPLEEFRANPDTTRASLFLDALSAATTAAEEDAILGALDTLPAYVGGFNHDTAKKEILGILQEAINFHPRSLQKKIGPSEIGTECDHCLAAKLAGWEQVDRDAWLPTVGTAVHSWIESAFGRIHTGPGGTRRFLTERRVSVGEIDGDEITGSTDLCDVVLGCTWDWKIVGPTTLKSAKTGPSKRYIVQQMLYGRGWNRLGVKVTRVGIAYLPRNAMSLNAGVWWSADYDEQIAVDALERASGFARNIRALASIGPAAVDSYVSGLPRWRLTRPEGKAVEGNGHEGQITCLDCARYKDYPADPAEALKQLDGLM